MIGVGFVVFGYAIFYWGLHHFPGVDCDTQNGCRYSLVDVLGISRIGQGISRGYPVQMNPDQSQNPGTGQPSTAQPQNPKPSTNPAKSLYCSICQNTSPLRLFGVNCPGC